MKPLRSTYPVGHLLNPATRYTPAAATDLRKTFERVRREQTPTIFDKPTNQQVKR